MTVFLTLSLAHHAHRSHTSLALTYSEPPPTSHRRAFAHTVPSAPFAFPAADSPGHASPVAPSPTAGGMRVDAPSSPPPSSRTAGGERTLCLASLLCETEGPATGQAPVRAAHRARYSSPFFPLTGTLCSDVISSYQRRTCALRSLEAPPEGALRLPCAPWSTGALLTTVTRTGHWQEGQSPCLRLAPLSGCLVPEHLLQKAAPSPTSSHSPSNTPPPPKP